MTRREVKVPEVYMRRSAVAAAGMQEARGAARLRAVECVHAVEDLLLRVVSETGLLRGMPVLWGATDERGALRGIRFRSSLNSRGEKLQQGEQAFVLSNGGVFVVASLLGTSWRTAPVSDDAIIAEDAPIAASLACDVLERHIRLLDERTVKMVALERWTTKLRDLVNEAP